jgi:hypothetical protein
MAGKMVEGSPLPALGCGLLCTIHGLSGQPYGASNGRQTRETHRFVDPATDKPTLALNDRFIGHGRGRHESCTYGKKWFFLE